LDRVQRPGTAPASRRSAGSRTPTGGKKKSKLSTKELDKKLRQSKLRNLLRRIKEEAEAGPNYHGVTKVNPLDFYEFGEEIGKGAFGKVREATHLLTGARVAVKTYEKHIIRKFESRRADVGEKIANTPDDESGSAGKKRTGNLNDRRPFCVEAEILVRLNHANCVELYQTIDSAQRIHVIIEYVDGGTLDQYRKQFQERKLEEADAARCFAQIVAALEYVHSRSICHRDVKLDNVLLYKHTQEVRLADYGLGEFVEKGKKLKLLCGTPAYVAPEIVENKQYSGTAVDVWSLGVLLFITVTGHSPYKGKTHNDMLRAIMRARLPTSAPGWAELSTELQDLISVMLQGNPKIRATMSEVAAHPWVRAGAADVAGRRAASGTGVDTGAAPPVGIGIPESEVDHEALAELEGFGFDRETVLAALAGGKRNSITATYRLALHQRALRARDSASASGMFAVRDGAPRRSGGWTAPEGEDSDDAGADGPLSLADIP
jgi:serine/threonine protein kinase